MKAFTVIFEDDLYGFVKSEMESKIRILFNQHAFILDVPGRIWQSFCAELLNDFDQVSVSLYSNITLVLSKRPGKVTLCSYWGEEWRDCIELTMFEWSRFQSILAANAAVFK